jgi:hypothetical protein
MGNYLSRWRRGWLFVVLGALALVVGVPLAGAAAASPSAQEQPQHHNTFTFKLVPTNANIKACLPHARGQATIERGAQNDELTLHVNGLAPNTGYDLFVIEIPHAPFGISWYQSDLQTNHEGEGTVSVRGIFNVETFSVSQPNSPTTTFSPTHQYHLGLWFNDPNVPFKLGCEPGATSPIITPFNGEQHAGIQVLNTSNFPDNAGPLSHVPA